MAHKYGHTTSRRAKALEATEEAGTRYKPSDIAKKSQGVRSGRAARAPASAQAAPEGRAATRVARKSVKARANLGLTPRSAAGKRADERRRPKTSSR